MAKGDLSAQARRRAAELADAAENDAAAQPLGATIHADLPVSTDPRLPAPGTAIVELRRDLAVNPANALSQRAREFMGVG